MTMAQVEKEDLGGYVVMPRGLDISFKSWWRFLDLSTTVDLTQDMETVGKYLIPPRQV